MREYVNKFNQLARFGLDLVNTPHKKALRFANGLNEPLHGLAMSHIPTRATFEKLVDMALMYEEETKSEKKEEKLEGPQNKRAGPKKETQKKDEKLMDMDLVHKGGKKETQKKGEKSEDKKEKKCFTCGSLTHLNKDCRKRKGTCFNCGEMGHFTRDCPKKRGQGQKIGPTSGGQANTLEASG